MKHKQQRCAIIYLLFCHSYIALSCESKDNNDKGNDLRTLSMFVSKREEAIFPEHCNVSILAMQQVISAQNILERKDVRFATLFFHPEEEHKQPSLYLLIPQKTPDPIASCQINPLELNTFLENFSQNDTSAGHLYQIQLKNLDNDTNKLCCFFNMIDQNNILALQAMLNIFKNTYSLNNIENILSTMNPIAEPNENIENHYKIAQYTNEKFHKATASFEKNHNNDLTIKDLGNENSIYILDRYSVIQFYNAMWKVMSAPVRYGQKNISHWNIILRKNQSLDYVPLNINVGGSLRLLGEYLAIPQEDTLKNNAFFISCSYTLSPLDLSLCNENAIISTEIDPDGFIEMYNEKNEIVHVLNHQEVKDLIEQTKNTNDDYTLVVTHTDQVHYYHLPKHIIYRLSEYAASPLRCYLITYDPQEKRASENNQLTIIKKSNYLPRSKITYYNDHTSDSISTDIEIPANVSNYLKISSTAPDLPRTFCLHTNNGTIMIRSDKITIENVNKTITTNKIPEKINVPTKDKITSEKRSIMAWAISKALSSVLFVIFVVCIYNIAIGRY